MEVVCVCRPILAVVVCVFHPILVVVVVVCVYHPILAVVVYVYHPILVVVVVVCVYHPTLVVVVVVDFHLSNPGEEVRFPIRVEVAGCGVLVHVPNLVEAAVEVRRRPSNIHHSSINLVDHAPFRVLGVRPFVYPCVRPSGVRLANVPPVEMLLTS